MSETMSNGVRSADLAFDLRKGFLIIQSHQYRGPRDEPEAIRDDSLGVMFDE